MARARKAQRDWIDFLSGFVRENVKQLADMSHAAGKEAMMFLGDQWIGTEPYKDGFDELGLDAVVGSIGDGTTTRMIADIPGVKYTEGRFLPYFFPDTFYEGNDPSIEGLDNWRKARRAILRSPISRMGYGGYLSLAAKFPKFVDTVTHIANEFRDIHDRTGGVAAEGELNVAILNSWGKMRSWMAFTVAHALPNKQTYSYYGILESLSGMRVNVRFISFDDVLAHGIDSDIDVIINGGPVDTAFTGGDVWTNPKLVETVRAWVRGGGAFVGVGEPSSRTAFPGWSFLPAGRRAGRGRGALSDAFGGQVFPARGAGPLHHRRRACRPGRPRGLGEGRLPHPAERLRRRPGHQAVWRHRLRRPVREHVSGQRKRDAAARRRRSGTARDQRLRQGPRRIHLRSALFGGERPSAGTRAVLGLPQRRQVCGLELVQPGMRSRSLPRAGLYCVINNTDQPQSTDVALPDGSVEHFDLDQSAIAWRNL